MKFKNSIVDNSIIDENPLRKFVYWLLINLNKKFMTVAFAHNGGKYDTLFVFKEIYNIGKNF